MNKPSTVKLSLKSQFVACSLGKH